jgi:hypothetical protein
MLEMSEMANFQEEEFIVIALKHLNAEEILLHNVEVLANQLKKEKEEHIVVNVLIKEYNIIILK